MTLAAFLAWLVSGGGIGQLSYEVVTWCDAIPWYWYLAYDWRRRLSFVITGLVALLLGWGALMLIGWLGIAPVPATPQDWANALFTIVASAILSAQDKQGRVTASARAA